MTSDAYLSKSPFGVRLGNKVELRQGLFGLRFVQDDQL
jgi:hypothetical protein